MRRVEAEREEFVDDENVRGEIGIDGLRTEDDVPMLDVEDLAILLRANQLLRGTKSRLRHLFVDEAQDLSPMKLAALIGRTGDVRGTAVAKGAVTVAGRRRRIGGRSVRPAVDHAGGRHRPAAVPATTASATGAACWATWG